MSKTLQQIYTLNPKTSFLDTDLFYGAESPYTPNTDFGFNWATLKAQIKVLSSSPAQTIYVSNDGNDTTGTGTISQPFLTYEKARSVAVPTAAQGHQFVIIPIGQFNITGNMILSPYVNISGYSNYSTQFDITGSVILDTSFNTIPSPSCQVMGIDIAAATGINLVFTSFQDSQIQFENVDFSNTPTFTATGAGLNINGELVIINNCISKGSVPSFTFTNILGVIVNSVAGNGVTSINNSSVTSNTCILDSLYGPNSAFTFTTTSTGNQNVLVQNVFFFGGTFTVDGTLNNILIDSSSYMTTPVFMNGATQGNISLLSLADGIQANTNFTPSNYTPTGTASYQANSTTGNLHGIDIAFGSIGVVNTGTLNHLAYYAATGSTISQTTANNTTTKQYLSQTGNGITPNAPTWSTIAVADVTGAANAPGNTNITSLTGLTGPIEQPTVIASNTGAIMLGFAYQSSAVNYINVFNAATGVYPFFISEGSDANIDFGIRSKGTGKINLVSTSLTNPITIFNGTLAQHATNLLFSNTASTRNVTFQDADGTLAFTSQLLSSPLTTKGDLWAWSTTNDRLPVASGNGKILQVDSTASTGLSYSTATYPVTAGTSGNIIKSNGTNFVSGAPAQINIQLLTSGTTYTPTSNTFMAIFELIGGGGSGGGTGSTAAAQCVASAGGGGGGYISLTATATQIALGITYSIGAAGAAPTAGGNAGNAGGATTLTIGGGTAWQGGGGGGGTAALGAAPSTQVTGGTGGTTTTGTNGTLIVALGGCPGFSGLAISAANYNQGGNGGGGLYGMGGGKGGASGASAVVGLAGVAKGAGGGGSSSVASGSALSAGAGVAGIIIVTEYIS